MMKYLLTMLCVVLSLCSCGDDENTSQLPSEPAEAERTVIVYMAAENNLSSYTTEDINEMVEASESLPENVNLVAFVDKSDKSTPPYVLNIKAGSKTVDDNYICTEDFYASDPEKMYEVLSWIMSQYPAKSYGLVLWGHAGGWLIEKDTIAYDHDTEAVMRRAYGVDTGSDLATGSGLKWINIPSLAKVLERLPEKFKFIFADCCNFQTVETAYELRNVAEYIIASPAETPVVGAPYDKIVPYMFSDADDFYKGIVDDYNSMVVNGKCRVPLSVIRTSEMENLAQSSREIMYVLADAGDLSDTDNLIYYRGYYRRGYGYVKVMLDMNDVIMRNVGDTGLYQRWKAAFDRAVIYKAMSKEWLTDGFVSFDFDVTEERYGGVSVFIPQDIYDIYYDEQGYDYNRTIRQMQWYYAAGVENCYTENVKNQDADKVL